MRISSFQLSNGPFDEDLLRERWMQLAEKILADGGATFRRWPPQSSGGGVQLYYWTSYKTVGIINLYLFSTPLNAVRVILVIHEY